MDPDDDQIHYHRTKWPRKISKECTNNVRICITFRWLGKRAKFLGEDYGGRSGERQHTQAIQNPRQIINECKSETKKKAFKKVMRHAYRNYSKKP